MELVTYQKYRTVEEAAEMVHLLKDNDIDYYIENIAPSIDITFSGGTELEHKIAIKLYQNDFDRVDKLMCNIAANNIDLVEEDHYLFEFTDNELFDMFKRYDEWNKTDLVLARKILKEHGKDITDQQVEELKKNRIKELKVPDKGSAFWLTVGFILAFLGGFFGMLIGYYHFWLKKILPNGDKVLVYNKRTQTSGMIMFCIGTISFTLWIMWWYKRILL
ncbi:MAG: hypothetical protein N4A72_06630 [Bacteroidales bacterium]|jgi:hypothetical protein|nr:hypothetical protein [Bacteroidales bacterium]